MKPFIFVSLFTLALAQVHQFPEFHRPCSERSATIRPNVRTGFNMAGYSGTWFEISRYQQRDEPEFDCVTRSYGLAFPSRFNIQITSQLLDEGQFNSRHAFAFLAFPEASPTLGLLKFTVNGDLERDELNVNYYILETDHFQYAFGWGCEDLEGSRSREYAWILSRTPKLPEAYNERANNFIDTYLDRAYIRNTTQSDGDCLSINNVDGNKIQKGFYGKN